MRPPTEAILRKLKVMRNNAAYRYCWNEEHNNMSQDCIDERIAMQYAVDCAEWFLHERDTEAEITERLKQSVDSYIANLTEESACEFLSKLSTHDENGQLIKEEE